MPESKSHPCQSQDSPRGDLQNALHRVLKSLVFRGNPDSPLNELPVSQLRALYVIAYEEGLKMHDVSQKLEIKLPAMSQVVDRLVKRGMVERRPDPDDRRAVRLHLTESARVIMADSNAERQARLDATADHLDVRDIDKVIEGLKILANAAEFVEAEERQSAPRSSDADPMVELMSRRQRSLRVQTAAAGMESATKS